jgi:hypothetical protein
MTVIASFKITSDYPLEQIIKQINLPISVQRKIGDLKGRVHDKKVIYYKKNTVSFKISDEILIDDAIKIIDLELSKIDFQENIIKNQNFFKELYFSMLGPFMVSLESIEILNKWQISFGID